jgi:hypothetical protein
MWVFSYERSFKGGFDWYVSPQDRNETGVLVVERWNATCDSRPGAAALKPFKAYPEMLNICNDGAVFHMLLTSGQLEGDDCYHISREVRTFDPSFDDDNEQISGMINVYFP